MTHSEFRLRRSIYMAVWALENQEPDCDYSEIRAANRDRLALLQEAFRSLGYQKWSPEAWHEWWTGLTPQQQDPWDWTCYGADVRFTAYRLNPATRPQGRLP